MIPQQSSVFLDVPKRVMMFDGLRIYFCGELCHGELLNLGGCLVLLDMFGSEDCEID